MICHNGEINTLRGNYNWMAARQATMASPTFGDDMQKLWPISYEGQSDSACFDNALELLFQGGYSLPHAMMMMIPEAWAGNPLMDEERRAFYEYHAALMEPWDGPAAIAFTDGRVIGATLDRNGLRPARYLETADGRVLMASEMGVLPIEESNIVRKWRLQPGKMLLIDLEAGKIISDDDLKRDLATSHPYREWLARTQIRVKDLPDTGREAPRSTLPLLKQQQAFGYSQEDIKFLMEPMAQTGAEAVGAMGTDTPISALSSKSKNLSTYFKQLFAQVTNPPIDPIREEIVMSLVSFIGPRPNLLDLKGTSALKRLEVMQPILSNEGLEKIRRIGDIADNQFMTTTLDITMARDRGPEGMEAALDAICDRAETSVRHGYNIIILSDRLIGSDRVGIPSLLATSAVHHHLIRKGLRTSVGLVVETGEAREVHQFCTLAGYGAEAVNPWLAFETLGQLREKMDEEIAQWELNKRYTKAINKGILKVMSKMGISTYQSYCGAQIFDAVGLSSDFVAKYFTGTHTGVEGVGLEEIARETFMRHADAFGHSPVLAKSLDVGGEYAFRFRGEKHSWTPDTVADLQHAVRGNVPDKYREFAKAINEQSEQLMTMRGMFRLRPAAETGRTPVPLDEVEPAAEIVKRFATGAMSFGSISREAHTTLAKAMNSLGGKSNTGEGGEEVDRFTPEPGWLFRAVGDQASRVGPVRGDDRVSGQLGHDPDQDGPGREARRRRPAARPQGRRGDRQGPAFDPGRRPDQPAAAPRYLLDRGSGAADLRPEERLAHIRHQREAGQRNRRRHGRRGCFQGPRRPCDDFGLRGRDGRVAPDFDQARWQPLGNRPGGNPADAGRQRPARTDQRAGRRRPAHGPRCGRRRTAGR